MNRFIGLLLALAFFIGVGNYANANADIVCKRNALGAGNHGVNTQAFPKKLTSLKFFQLTRWSLEGNYLQYKFNKNLRYKCNVGAAVALKAFAKNAFASTVDKYICVNTFSNFLKKLG